MTANVVIAAVAAAVAIFLIRSIRDLPGAPYKIAMALVGVGLAAYALAYVMADGSC